jgi:alpha/beta hydrolase fold
MEDTGYANVTIATETRQIEILGHSIRVSVRRTGRDGPPLLLFNGIGANLELLQPFIEALGDIETVVFDLPGAGASPEPLLPYRLFDMARLANRLMTKLGYEGGSTYSAFPGAERRRNSSRSNMVGGAVDSSLPPHRKGCSWFRGASDPC